jgi:hypothetical protein
MMAQFEVDTEETAIPAGKRYECAECGGQMICTRGGNGSLTCCGEPMSEVEAKALPSAD